MVSPFPTSGSPHLRRLRPATPPPLEGGLASLMNYVAALTNGELGIRGYSGRTGEGGQTKHPGILSCSGGKWQATKPHGRASK